MFRKWIPISRLVIFDKMHFETPDGWDVNEEKDGQSKAKHVEGIEYIKNLIRHSSKIRPILVVEDEFGDYIRLDGFKRCMAAKELGERFIEAFVCTKEEVERRVEFPYLHGVMWAGKGGQMKEVYTSVVEGYDQEGAFDYGKQKFLYTDPEKPHGLKIELSESIHVHWGECGRYRIGMGRRDFEKLAKAISSIVWE